MYIVRIIHAVYSLSIIYFGYKIANKYAEQKVALLIAWLLAVLWFMPWLSVRNLVEFQCIPFLLWGVWLYIKKDSPSIKMILLSGLISGIAFSIRFQSLFFLAGFGLALLCLKQFRNAFIWGFATLGSMAIVQGCIDLGVWGKPFVEFQEYVKYNIEAAGDYLRGGVLKYIWVILGLLLPPVSCFIFFGFFARWKKYLLLFLPSFIFLLFHSLFINKQERFILTIVPSVIILGLIGWHEFYAKYKEVKWLKSLLKTSVIIFMVLNTVLLCLISVHYSKKARVETMLHLSKYDNIEVIAFGDDVPMMPLFYLNQWVKQSSFNLEDIKRYKDIEQKPRFIVLTASENTPQMVDSLKTYFPDLVFETQIKPNYIDKLLYNINKHNRNETLFVYRNRAYFKQAVN